jgi:excisionase family DNA binding protein
MPDGKVVPASLTATRGNTHFEGTMAQLLALSEVAERLGTCRETVVRLIESEDLRAYRIRHQWRVSESDLQNYLNRVAKGPAAV